MAAKATYKQEFDRVMDELKEIDADAHRWLDSHSTTKWARHMFRLTPYSTICVRASTTGFLNSDLSP